MIEELSVAALAISITSPVLSWIIFINRGSSLHASKDAGVGAELQELKKEVLELRMVVGNGMNAGLRGDIKNMQVKCASEMAVLSERVASIREKR